jgi:hypothetical protein
MRTHFLNPRQKKDLDEIVKVMIYVGEWSWDLIIYLLDFIKNEFCEVDVMFEGVIRPCEIIFRIMGIQNSELVEIT